MTDKAKEGGKVKEHPMIFQPWKAAGINGLAPGYEAQTRRIVSRINSHCAINEAKLDFKSDRVFVDPGPSPIGNPGPYLHVPFVYPGEHDDGRVLRVYPRWQPGDRLWVKETYHFHKKYDSLKPSLVDQKSAIWYSGDHPDPSSLIIGKVRQSIFMPRWASRSLCEITEVRAQRIQDISDVDAVLEGTPVWWRAQTTDVPLTWSLAFSVLWDSINGKKYPWSANDWVWVYTMRRIGS